MCISLKANHRKGTLQLLKQVSKYIALKATQSALATSGEVGAGDWAADKHPLFKTPAENPVCLSPPLLPTDTSVHLLGSLQNEASHSGRVNYSAEP